jgi:hypothetical protein
MKYNIHIPSNMIYSSPSRISLLARAIGSTTRCHAMAKRGGAAATLSDARICNHGPRLVPFGASAECRELGRDGRRGNSEFTVLVVVELEFDPESTPVEALPELR